ncbi:MAG: DUF5915 domain-containing protein, partial [Bacteroidales bacterium]|nr:DUF5915 domain-containing protein [Bacteroidales bacterium]
KPNFKVLGKRYTKQMKEISNAFANFTQEEIFEIESSESYKIHLSEGVVEITPQDVEITSEDMPGWLVASEGKLTLALDITITDELRREGVARELVNRIQNLRKDSNFDVTDKIRIELESREEIVDTLTVYKEYICNQTLASELIINNNIEGGNDIEWDEGVLKIKLVRL